MHIMLQLFGITAAMSMILNLIGREFFTEGVWIGIPATIMSLLLYGLGYCAAHTSIPAETVEEEIKPDKPASKEETDDLMNRIDQIMREKLLYSNPKLTIADVASVVNSNRTYVSNSINRTYGVSFSQYIARQRVAYAQLLLRDTRYQNDHEAIADAIALSGFSSDQSFYRAFKEITGITPLQYRHQNQPNS